MTQMILMVLNNPEHCSDILNIWENSGATGITILESTGLMRLKNAGKRDDLPLMPGMRHLLRANETHHRTIFSIVDDEIAQKVIAAMQQLFDEMAVESSGVLFLLPVSETHRFVTAKARAKGGE